MNNNTTQFQLDKTYSGSFTCDSDRSYNYKVIRRTEKTIWLKNADLNEDITYRRKIYVCDGVENTIGETSSEYLRAIN